MVSQHAPTTQHVVVMGVSGCGKSTVAELLSDQTGTRFAEADVFHSAGNKEKMAAGIPLNDQDRWPWLRDLATWTADQAREGRSTVMACSALKRSYRDLLRTGPPRLDFVHLDGSPDTIRTRMATRRGHYMPASLLESQIATLEPLQPDESGVVLDLQMPPEELVVQALVWLRTMP